MGMGIRPCEDTARILVYSCSYAHHASRITHHANTKTLTTPSTAMPGVQTSKQCLLLHAFLIASTAHAALVPITSRNRRHVRSLDLSALKKKENTPSSSQNSIHTRDFSVRKPNPNRSTRKSQNRNNNKSNYYADNNNPARKKWMSELQKRMAELRQKAEDDELTVTQTLCDSTLGLARALNNEDDVKAVLEIMQRQGLKQEHSTYQSEIQQCFEVGNSNASLKILDAMKRSVGMKPDAVDVQLVVATLDRNKQWKKGLELIYDFVKERERSGEDRGVIAVESYDITIQSMRESASPSPSPQRGNNYNNRRHQKRNYSRDDSWMDALQLLEDMQSNEFHPAPDLSTHHAVLLTLMSAGRAEEATQMVLSMPNCGVMPAAHTYNLAISICHKAGQWRKGLKLLDAMEEQGVSPGTNIFNSLISSCAKNRQLNLVMKLFAKMKERSVMPDTVTYNTVMSACASAGKWKDALELLDKINLEPTVFPDVITYTTAMRACIKGRNTGRALTIFEMMKDRKMNLDVYAYSSAIDACAKGNKWKLGLDYLDEMRKAGIKPNPVTYSAAINACGNGGKWEMALELLSQVSESIRVVDTNPYFVDV